MIILSRFLSHVHVICEILYFLYSIRPNHITPRIRLSILISATFVFIFSFLFNAQHTEPYISYDLTTAL